jgi:hypothetical protein
VTASLADLWAAYMQADAQVTQARRDFREAQLAGGTSMWTGQYSAALYQALNVADAAYVAWAAAVKGTERGTGQFAAYGGGE